MNRRWRWLIAAVGVAAVVAVGILSRGCWQKPPTAPGSLFRDGDSYRWGEVSGEMADGRWVESGTLGRVATQSEDGRHEFVNHFIKVGPEWVIAGYLDTPVTAGGPVYVLLLRDNLPPSSTSHTGDSGTSGTPTERLHSHAAFTARTDSPFWVRFTLPKQGPEQFSLGGKAYPLADGRTFLIDLTTDPAKVEQVPADLSALLPTGPPGKHDLTAVPGKLAGMHPPARDFWTR